jgi:putative restriction endonuclease
MHGLIAVTDHDWFHFLRGQGLLEEVNFWRPSDVRTPQQLSAGMPVVFKLRKRYGGWIVGFGIFARHDVLPAWLAWEAFEQRNGAPTFAEMHRRIERLRRDRGGPTAESGDYQIGCLMLSTPFFLEREDWVRPPSGWPENVVQGKRYDLSNGEGARVWQECQTRVTRAAQVGEPARQLIFPGERHGAPIVIKPRLGQGIFRIAVTDAYGRACAVTSEHSLPALEAAHIRPFGEGGEHEVPNGLLLRSDIHKLFDRGYVGVTPDHRFVVSKRLKDHFANGRSYYPLHGQLIQLPERAEERPRPRLLEWHMKERFRG